MLAWVWRRGCEHGYWSGGVSMGFGGVGVSMGLHFNCTQTHCLTLKGFHNLVYSFLLVKFLNIITESFQTVHNIYIYVYLIYIQYICQGYPQNLNKINKQDTRKIKYNSG